MHAPIAIYLYDRIAEGTNFVADLTDIAQDWRHTIRAIGGFWQADFTITEEDMTRSDMIHFYTWHLGRRIEERTYGQTVSWEGEIVQMEFTLNGETTKRTLHKELFHNRQKVQYRDATTKETASTAWKESSRSTDMFGDAEYIDIVGDNYNSTSAVALRDRRYTAYSWPRPRPVQMRTRREGEPVPPNQIRVLCAGFWESVNRRFRESDNVAGNASAVLATLIGASEFVTSGLIDTNTLSVPLTGSEVAFRIWDGMSEIIEMGDASGNRWAGGIYAGRVFNYAQAETAITHYWKDGELHDAAMGNIIAPSLVKADIIVRQMESPFQTYQAGGNVSDSAMNAYIGEVEYIRPDSLILTPEEVLL